MEKAVPKISFTVPTSFLAIDLCLMVRAMLMTASNVMFPLCLMFFTFFRSRGGSFNSFKIKAEAVGTIVGVAYKNLEVMYIRRKKVLSEKERTTRLMTLSLTTTLIPFQSMVAFWISSPTFFGDKPKGPSFGASEEAEPISPPTAFIITIFSSPAAGGGPIFF